jgi:predicted ABC-type ATPase
MFAGPNGSGKTTLYRALAREYSRYGVFRGGPFVNADDIEAELTKGSLDLSHFGIHIDAYEFNSWLSRNAWGPAAKSLAEALELIGPKVYAKRRIEAPYAAAILTAWLRERLLEKGVSFSFETVMSHPSKVDFLAKARKLDYRTYLYFVATEAVDINVGRVQVRVQLGEHAVPESKIRERYARSIALLPDAIRNADRSYLFDNSGQRHVLVAELNGVELVSSPVRRDAMPSWADRALRELGC